MRTIFNYLRFVVLSVVVVCLSTSCDDDKSVENSVPQGPGIFILNEGSWGKNNASISFYHFDCPPATIFPIPRFFLYANCRPCA